jgi:hypothetical protein
MSTGLSLFLALIFIPLAFFIGGGLVKFGCYLVGRKMPGLFKAGLIGLLASAVSGWVAPTLMRFVPMNDHVVAVVLSSLALTVLISGVVFKMALDISYAKGVAIGLVHRSISITTALVAVAAYVLLT